MPAAFVRRKPGQRDVVENPPRDVIHHEEARADDRGIVAQRAHSWHRNGRLGEGLRDAVLAFHRVRGGQQLARRFLAQHIAPVMLVGDQEGRVRHAALELRERARPRKASDMRLEPRGHPGFVEAVFGQNRDGLIRPPKGGLALSHRIAQPSFIVGRVAGARGKRKAPPRVRAAPFPADVRSARLGATEPTGRAPPWPPTSSSATRSFATAPRPTSPSPTANTPRSHPACPRPARWRSTPTAI